MHIYTPKSNILVGEISEVIWEDPRDLLHPDRLDIAVKICYAKYCLNESTFLSGSDPVLLYDSHINARTGGIEPNAIYSKKSLEEYKHYFDVLLQRIRTDGYDPSEPIRISSRTGLILNGAHRLAISLVLKLDKVPVVYDSNAVGRPWGFDWFMQNGFSYYEMREILLQYVSYEQEGINYGIIWPSDDFDSLEVVLEISKSAKVLFLEKVDFSIGLEEFIYDVYSYDKGVDVHNNSINIVRKSLRLKSKNKPEVMLLVIQCDNFTETVELRDRVRSLFACATNEPSFDVLHMGATVSESQHLKRIMMSPSTLRSYNSRLAFSTNLVNKLYPLLDWAKSNDLDLTQICVVGGAVLDLFEYKKCDDIDIVLPYSIRRKFSGSNACELMPGLDLAGYGYSKKHSIGNWRTDDQLVNNYDLFVYARGLKFADFPIVFERKRVGGREKDKNDLLKVAEKSLGMKINCDDDFPEIIEDAPVISQKKLIEMAEFEHVSGKLHRASRYYALLIKIWPDEPVGWTGMGLCAMQRGDIVEARKQFSKAISLDKGGALLAKNYLSQLD